MNKIDANRAVVSSDIVVKSDGKRAFVSALPLLVSLAISALAAGCASGPEMFAEAVQERPPVGTIEPIAKPQWSAGAVHERLDVLTGEPSGYEITQVLDNDELRMKSLDGCIWDSSRDWFSPVSRWENCGTNPAWKSGTNTIQQLEGELWPLAPGNTVAYKRTPVSSSGETGTAETRRCEVSGPYNIDVAVGNVDVLKVLCSTRRWDNKMEYRSWYWSEEHGPVKYMKARQGSGIVSHNEMVKVTTDS